MTAKHSWATLPHTFLGLDPAEHTLEASRVVLLPAPYDATTSYKGGTREGPAAIIRASRQMEDYDPELDAPPCDVGIHTATELEPHARGPEAMVARVTEAYEWYAAQGKLVGMLGGEHSLTPAGVSATAKHYPNLSVLYFDAQADLRNEYQDSPHSHASAARRSLEHAPVSLVGIRSMAAEEMALVREKNIPFFQRGPEPITEVDSIVDTLSDNVYISFDLDAFDPAVVAGVGTPEPGGLGWWEALRIIRAAAQRRRVVGFDVMELAPGEGPEAGAYAAAKLVYKIIGYATCEGGSAARGEGKAGR
ncbi:MAG: agmatinase [Dehalococcoidia bacterium]